MNHYFSFIRKFLILFAALFAAATSANAEIINLTNGDRVTGTIVSATPEKIVLSTSFGQITIPRNTISLISANASDEAAAKGASSVVQSSAAAPSSTKADSKAVVYDETAPEPKAKEPEWVVDYRNFVHTYFPEGWQFKLRGGLALKETTSTNFSLNAAFDIKKEWDLNKFTATAFYDYTSETVNDVTNRTLDKYGAETTFRRDLDKSSHWYYENLLSYRRDTIKSIRDQVDEAVTLGYRFDFKRYNLYIDIAPGPAVRYINADNYDTKWVAMAVLAESLHWDISKLLVFEQSTYAGFNVQKPDEYSAYLKLALLVHATEVMDIALRYTYSYDAINASTAQKSEQTLLLSFEFPFNWK